MRLYSVAYKKGKSAQNRTLYLSQSAICAGDNVNALLFYDKTRTFAQGIKKKTSPSIMQCPHCLWVLKRQSTHFTRFPYRKGQMCLSVGLFWLGQNGSLSNALKSTSKSGVSSCCGVVKTLFVTLSGKGLVIVGSSRTSSQKVCAVYDCIKLLY